MGEEGTTGEISQNNEASVQLSHRETPDAWQTKIQDFSKIPFPLFWILIAGIIFLAGCAVVIFNDDNKGAIRLLAMKSVLLAAIANAIIYYERIIDAVADDFWLLLDETKEKAKTWVDRWYRIIFWSKTNFIIGLFLGAVCVIFCGKLFSSEFMTKPGIGFSYSFTFLVGFMGGSLLWTMLGIAGMAHSLGKEVKIKPSIFAANSSALHAESSILWRVSITASLIYLFGVLTCLVLPGRRSSSLLGFILFFGLFIICYFIYPQINIHRKLLKKKQTKLESISEKIDSSFDRVSREPTAENITQLRNLFLLQKIVNGKRPWSFGISELLLLISSVLLPLLFFIVEYLVKK